MKSEERMKWSRRGVVHLVVPSTGTATGRALCGLVRRFVAGATGQSRPICKRCKSVRRCAQVKLAKLGQEPPALGG